MSDTQTQDKQNKARRIQIGEVVAVSGNKTISVAVTRLAKHAIYNKYLRRTTKLAVHDEHGKAAVGDRVEIVPCRRLSRSKAHRLARVIQKGTNV